MRYPGTVGLRDVDVDGADVAELLDRLVGILQRLAVLALFVGRLRRAEALDRPGDDHRRPVADRHRLCVGAVDRLDVVAVDLDRRPAAGLGAPRVRAQVPAAHRLAKLAEPVDVDDHHEVAQPLHAGVLNGLPDRALRHLGVTAQRPHAVRQAVELPRAERDPGGDRHPLCQRAGGDVHPGQRRGGMALEPRAELAEREQLLVGDRTGSGEHGVEERRGVPLGEDQVVVVGVLRVLIGVVQVTRHKHSHQVRGRHRRGRVTRRRGGGRPNRVDAQALREQMDLFVGHHAFLRDRSPPLLKTTAQERVSKDVALKHP